jgi:DnaJ homolog subfamily B member 4
LRVATLDGRTLSLPIDEIVTPSTCKKVVGEGMPIFFKPKDVKDYLNEPQKGSLFVKFNFIFPRNLTDD